MSLSELSSPSSPLLQAFASTSHLETPGRTKPGPGVVPTAQAQLRQLVDKRGNNRGEQKKDPEL